MAHYALRVHYMRVYSMYSETQERKNFSINNTFGSYSKQSGLISKEGICFRSKNGRTITFFRTLSNDNYYMCA